MNVNKGAKPKDVLCWLQKHNPNPWPTANANSLSKIIRRIEKTSCTLGISLCLSVVDKVFPPLTLKWDARRPADINQNKRRHLQVKKYLDANPSHKPRQVLC